MEERKRVMKWEEEKEEDWREAWEGEIRREGGSDTEIATGKGKEEGGKWRRRWGRG